MSRPTELSAPGVAAVENKMLPENEKLLFAQIEPVACHRSVARRDVKIIRVVTQRAGHCDVFIATVLTAGARPTFVSGLDTEIGMPTAAILITVADSPTSGTFVIGLIAWLTGSGLGASRPGETPALHGGNQSVHRRVTGWYATP